MRNADPQLIALEDNVDGRGICLIYLPSRSTKLLRKEGGGGCTLYHDLTAAEAVAGEEEGGG